MTIADYYPILVQISIASGIGAVILVASHIFGQRGTSTAIKRFSIRVRYARRGIGARAFRGEVLRHGDALYPV